MIRRMLFVSAFLLLASPAWSATYYVAKAVQGGSDSNNCATAQTIGTPKLTILSGISCLTAPGDSLYVREGTYAEEIKYPSFPASGTSAPSGRITVARYQAEVVTVAPTSSHCRGFLFGPGKNWITLDGINLQGSGMTGCPSLRGGTLLAVDEPGPTGATIKNLDIHNGPSSNLFSGDQIVLENLTVHTTGLRAQQAGYANGSIGLYLAALRNSLVKNVVSYDNTCAGIRVGTSFAAPSPMGNNNILENVTTHTNGIGKGLGGAATLCSSIGTGIIIENHNNTVRHFLSYNNAERGVWVYPPLQGTSGNKFYHGVITQNPYGVVTQPGTTDSVFKNNLMVGNTTANVSNAGTGTVLGSDNRTTGSLTDCTISASDFHLKDGANPCVDAGTTIAGLLSNGPPDQGRYERFTFSSGVANELFVDVTLGMGLDTPPVLTPAGFGVTCTGTNCAALTVTNASLLAGSSSIARLTATGWGGSGVCEPGQVIKASYSAAAGNTVNAVGQELASFTDQTVTNDCGTPAGGGPAAPTAHYLLDDGASGTTPTTCQDATVNNLDCTLVNGATWGPGKHGNAVSFLAGGTQYIQFPFGNAIDPTAQSFTIAMGYKPDAGLESSTRTFFGTQFVASRNFFLSTVDSTWRFGLQGTAASAASEFAVNPGYTHVCITFNSAIDTAVLHINGIAGAVVGGSVKTYTSFTFPANFRAGIPQGFFTDAAPGGTIDYLKYWTSVEDCLTEFNSWEPPSPPPSGTLANTAFRIYGALAVGGSAIPMAEPSTNGYVAPSGWFTYAYQTDCTVTACSSLAEKLHYSCALCPSGGTWLPIPDLMGPDFFSFIGNVPEPDVLSGPVAACVSGALTPNTGETQHTADAVPVFTLPQDNCITSRGVLQIGAGAGIGWQYCIRPFNQTGVELNSYTPPGGGCVTTITPFSNGFASRFYPWWVFS